MKFLKTKPSVLIVVFIGIAIAGAVVWASNNVSAVEDTIG